MKVKDVIKQLQQFDPELEVESYEGGIPDLVIIGGDGFIRGSLEDEDNDGTI
jgi:hypothetical protein